MLRDHLLTPYDDLPESYLGNADFSWFIDISYIKGENGKYCAAIFSTTHLDIDWNKTSPLGKNITYCYFSTIGLACTLTNSVQFSHSVTSDSLWPHESQYARPPCPSATSGVYSNSCPSSWWCHPAISSSVVSFSSCPQSLPAPESFPMSQLFTWGGQTIGVSASASILPMNTQCWSPLQWTGLVSLQSKGLSTVFSNNTVQKYQFFGTHLSSHSTYHMHTWPLEKP